MKHLARLPVGWTIAGAVLVALAVNLGIYALGASAGGSFIFTASSGPSHVDPLTLIGFTALPLAVALTVLAVVGRRWRGAFLVALVVAPLLELGSIFGMTLPADFDVTSTFALATCHVALVPVSIITVLVLKTRVRGRSVRVSGHPEPRTA